MPAVAILGPRQVSKTTLAQAISNESTSLYLDLENPADVRKLDDPAFYFEQHTDKFIVIDEVQRQPELFQILRGQIDRNRKAGHKSKQFLLLGSASNNLLNQSSESLAGRISYQELFPLNLLECPPSALSREPGQRDTCRYLLRQSTSHFKQTRQDQTKDHRTTPLASSKASCIISTNQMRPNTQVK